MEDEIPGLARSVLGRPRADVRDWWVDDVAYQIGSPTTAGLFRAWGVAVDGNRILPWSIFVKVLQAWRHQSLVAALPPELRRLLPTDRTWRYEAEVYRSNLDRALPEGLRPPRLYHHQQLDDDRIALWMRDVPTTSAPWDHDRFRRAALLLGRMAGRSTLGDLLPKHDTELPSWIRLYTLGRLQPFAFPALERDELWRHPLLAGLADRGLRSDLRELARRVPMLLDALDELPRVAAHGDACPQNLLVAEDDPDGFVVVDWTMAGPAAVGFDLGQLLVGLAHDGVLDVAHLPEVHEVILPAYAGGLADEGLPVDIEQVRFGFDAAMAVRSAFTALPLEHLDGPPTDELARLLDARVELTRYLVDLGLGLDLPA
jgi:Phosphotransferase enzyme family